jgi:rhomboid protease GluP
MNFAWASMCDHCRRPLDEKGDAAGRPDVAPVPDAGVATIDPDTLRRQQFLQALAAATPSVFVTPALIAANAAVFVFMIAAGVSPLNPVPDALVRWGADYGPLTTHGQWWRLFTAMFVHIGAVHLLMNMYVLWIIGRITERLFGNAGYLVLYLGTGLAGSLTSLIWHPLSIAAGASGAVFGLYGGLFGFLLIRRAVIPAETTAALARSGIFFVIANLLYGFTATGVDVTAHLGGFVTGIPLGCLLAVPLEADSPTRLRRSVLVALSVAALAGVVAARMPVVDDWVAEMKRLATLEQETAALYDTAVKNLQSNAITREEFARTLTAKLVPSWEAQRAVITKLRIPEPQRTTARRLGDYMSLRAESWRLTAQGIRSNDSAMIREGDSRQEAALAVLQTVRPDTAVTNRLAELRTARATADAFTGELERVSAADKKLTRIFNDSLTALKTGKIDKDQFADTIETQVVQPWTAERDKLSAVKAPEGQDDLAKRVLEYMSVKGEGWLLASRAIRANDAALMQKAAAKQVEASKIARAITPVKAP